MISHHPVLPCVIKRALLIDFDILATARIFAYVAYGILILNIILYLISFSKHTKAYKIFTVYLIFTGIIQTISEYYAHKGLNNHFLSTYYFTIRFILLSLFFCFLLKKVNASKSLAVITMSSIAIGITAIQYISDPQLYYQFNSTGFLITSIALIGYCMFYLYELLTKKSRFSYVVVGLLMYLMSSSVIFIAATEIISVKNAWNRYVWMLNAFLYIIYQLFISWEWKCLYSTRKNSL